VGISGRTSLVDRLLQRLGVSGLVGKILGMSITGVLLLGLCLGGFISYLLRVNAEEAALARVESNIRVAWEVLRENGSDFTVADGKLIVGGHVLNGGTQVVDKVRDLVGGTCTIFMGDVRVATNVLGPDGGRAVGTRLARSAAYDAIFSQHRPFRGEVDILGEPYITAYDPIFDRGGEVIGVLYVGIRQAEFLQTVSASLWTTAIATLVLSLMALAASFLIAQSSVVGPLQAAIAAMRRLAEGKLDVAVTAPTEDNEIGEMLRALAVFRANFIERAKLDVAERAARERLAAAVESISEGFTLWDEHDHLALCNHVWLTMWDLGPEVMGRSFTDILHAVTLPNLAANDGWLDQRMERHRIGTGTTEYKLLDGRVIQIRERRTADGCTVGIYADITESMRAASDNMRREKLAALGGLVAGVAHEINTPIGIGLTAASHLDEKVRDFARAYAAGQVKRTDMDGFLGTAEEVAASLLTNLRRAANLVRSFKQVAVDQSSDARRVFFLREYIDETLLSLQPQFKRTGHRIEVDCSDRIELDSFPGALSQVLANLVMNSLIHGFEHKPAGTIRIAVAHSGGDAVMTYQDDGKGMEADAAAQIFDPFFTTKRGSGGSGLGMHIVYTLVTETMGGRIDCVTAPDHGVTFTLRLPGAKET